MQPTTTNKKVETQSDLLNTQLNADANQNNSPSSQNTELIERIQIEHTPFWIIGNKQEGYFLAMGQWRLSENRETAELCQEQLYGDNKWFIIMNMVIALITTIKVDNHKEIIDKLQTYIDDTMKDKTEE